MPGLCVTGNTACTALFQHSAGKGHLRHGREIEVLC
jgi:hypothetical protein